MNLIFRNDSDELLPTTDSGYGSEVHAPDTDFVPIASIYSDSIPFVTSGTSTPLLRYQQPNSTMSVMDLPSVSATTFIRYPSARNLSQISSGYTSLEDSMSHLGLEMLFDEDLHVQAVSTPLVSTESSIVPLGRSCSAQFDTEAASTEASTPPASNVRFALPAIADPPQKFVAVSSDFVLAKIPDQNLWPRPPSRGRRVRGPIVNRNDA